MACGRPVLTTRLPGIDEIIQDGSSGFLVTPGSPVELRSKITALLREPHLLRAVGSEARLAMEKSFSWDVVTGLLVDEIERVFMPAERAARVTGGGVPS
jgi:glycosyltransferase involved in cell wall biosynthesis